VVGCGWVKKKKKKKKKKKNGDWMMIFNVSIGSDILLSGSDDVWW